MISVTSSVKRTGPITAASPENSRAHRVRTAARLVLTLMMLLGIALTGCASKKSAKGPGMIPHEMYGGCQIQGRHYHNTHVFIGDQYEPSLTEWLKY